jgi:hypothetical protein
MLRSDRNIAERMFENNVTKVSERFAFSLVLHRSSGSTFSRRFSAVLPPSPGESICPPTLSSSRVLKSTMQGKVLSSISVFSTSCKFSVELVSLLVGFSEGHRADNLKLSRSTSVRRSRCRLHLHDERQTGSLRLGDLSTTPYRIKVSLIY